MLKPKYVLTFLIALTLLAACGGEEPESPYNTDSGLGVWIDNPLPGDTLPMAPYNVLMHGSSPQGIAFFELSVNGVVYSEEQVASDQYGYGETLAYSYITWVPPAPGTYILSVRAKDLTGEYGPSAEVQIYVGEVSEERAQLPTHTPTEQIPVLEIPPSPTPTSILEACIFTAKVNLFCRSGPGSYFPDKDSFLPGVSAPVVGLSIDGLYWYVLGPNFGRVCTVPIGTNFGEVRGACGSIPPFTPIPPPATPTNTPRRP